MSTSDDMIVNVRSLDPLDQMIFERGLRIKKVWFDKESDVIAVLMTNRKILQRPISHFKRLANASEEELANFENTGVGINWPDLDEDLSLRGFLKNELERIEVPQAPS